MYIYIYTYVYIIFAFSCHPRDDDLPFSNIFDGVKQLIHIRQIETGTFSAQPQQL